MTLSLVGGLSNIPRGSLVIYLLCMIVLNLNTQMTANINMSNIVISVTVSSLECSAGTPPERSTSCRSLRLEGFNSSHLLVTQPTQGPSNALDGSPLSGDDPDD